ncbi:MAG: CDGSH iron-sulfur domain-containing protein [Actinomycetota bacterium]
MRIRIVPGGPMLVDGVPASRLEHDEAGFSLTSIETGSSYALCRCGRSSEMPLCDKTPPYACFEEVPVEVPEPGPFLWDVPDPSGPPAIALKPNGPIRVAGDVELTYGEAPLSGRDRWSLCRCGASRCQPVCDSSHKLTGFRG